MVPIKAASTRHDFNDLTIDSPVNIYRYPGGVCQGMPPCAVGKMLNQMRIGITTYLNPSNSGLVIRAELFASCNDTVTMSWLMLASTSIR